MRDEQAHPASRSAANRGPRREARLVRVFARRLPVLAFFLFLLSPVLLDVVENPQAAAQDALGELRQTVRAPDVPDPPDEEPRPKKRERRNAYGNDGCDDEDPWDSLIGTLAAPVVWAAGAVVTSPFWGPAVLIGDNYESPGYFPGFPYEDGATGAMMKDPWVPAPPRMWSMRLRGDYVDDFDAMSSIGGQVLWESSQRWGIDTEVRYRQEDHGGLPTDSLWTGDSNLVFRFAQSPQLQLRAGAGFNWLADEKDQDFGVNFTYGGDWYPVKPLVFSTEFDLGRLGRATYFHGRATAGVQVRRYELFTGYDYFDVGTVQIQGLVSGLRITF